MIGCLILHGFAGTREEITDVEKHLKAKNWLVYTPELPGHTGIKQDLADVSYQHWLAKAKVGLEELLERCEKVYIIGFSMGGVIASYLAGTYPVDRLVLLSPAAYYLNPLQIVQDLSGWFLEGLRGELNEDEYYQLYRDKIRNTPVKATLEFAKLVKRIRPLIERVDVPTLIIQGDKDGMVPPKSAEYIYETISSEQKEIFHFPNAKHYIWYSDAKGEMFAKIDAFLDQDLSLDESSEDNHTTG